MLNRNGDNPCNFIGTGWKVCDGESPAVIVASMDFHIKARSIVLQYRHVIHASPFRIRVANDGFNASGSSVRGFGIVPGLLPRARRRQHPGPGYARLATAE